MKPKYKIGDVVVSLLDKSEDNPVIIRHAAVKSDFTCEYYYWIKYPDGMVSSHVDESHLAPLDTPDKIFKELLIK